MEVLQLILNILGITGVTTLSLICYLVKRDNLALATEVRLLRQQQHRQDAPIVAQPASPILLKPTSAQPVRAAANHEDLSDISKYVAQRISQWSALTVPAGD